MELNPNAVQHPTAYKKKLAGMYEENDRCRLNLNYEVFFKIHQKTDFS